MELGELNVPFIRQGDQVIHPNPVRDGLVLWYDFSGMDNSFSNKDIAEDLSGNGNHGTLQNFNYTTESGYDKTGLLSTGLKFDGVDDEVITDGSDGRFMLNEFTAEWTGYIAMDSTETSSIVHLINSGYNFGWSLTYHSSGQLMLTFKNSLKSDGWERVYLSTSVLDPKFKSFNFVGVFHSHGIECYINGIYEESGSLEREIVPDYNTMYDLRLMQNVPGDLYSAKVYNRPLTPEEIAHNYAIEKERFNIGGGTQ